MSATELSLNTGRNSSEPKRKQMIHKGRALMQMYLLSSSVVSAAPSTALLEYGNLSNFHRSPIWHVKGCQASLIPSSRLRRQHVRRFLANSGLLLKIAPHRFAQTLSRPPHLYIHIFHPLRPLPRLSRRTCPAQSPELSWCGFRQEKRSSGCRGNLSVQGIPCFSRVLSPKGPKQLHVFLPTLGTAEDDDTDNESIDEGFMDEVVHKAL
ncbi:hypothetical protein HF521_015520 [Silurus meridionalis]|uniref:Uncharacterized protein n=1 Tax=Silurus meridionalis TaxID=175797 RepID=A0A8T0A3W9_SILME|nr:hypothetical protein HF521_015520 [Silurus meridionalis]